MRIGMMADAYNPHISGITHTISLYKQFFEAAGHQVFIFTFGDGDFLDDETNVLRSPGIPLGYSGYFFSPRYTRRARKLLQTMDIVHVHHPFLSGMLALRYCRPPHIPIVFTNHTRYDLYMASYLRVVPGILSERFLKTYLSFFFRAIDLGIAPSRGLADVLTRFGVTTPIQIIPNGIDLSRFRNKPPRDRFDLGIAQEDLVLVYTGRLAPEKNLSFLLQAFAGISESDHSSKLLLIGDGPQLDVLKDMASQIQRLERRVIFTGRVPYAEIPGYLAMADGFVTASVTEVHPLSLIEALASGLPVLGIDSPGVGDIVRDLENGFLSSNNLETFTAKMGLFVSQPGLRKIMAAQALEDGECYAIERTCQLVLGHYHRLVSQSPWQNHGNRVASSWK